MCRLPRRPWLALVALGIAGSLALPGAAPHADERVLLCFGDSLTAGLGVAPAEAYPARLGARLEAEGYRYRVVNAGVSGDTTAGGLRRVEWALRLAPEVVILALGANDGLRGQDLGAVRANLDELVTRFQRGGARVLLAGMRLPPNYGRPYATEFRRIYETVARLRRVAFMPFLLDGVGGDPRLNQPDGIHPNAEGHRVIAERLWPHLRPLLKH
jgi:acyl-CoA thioesterase-1